MDALRIVRRIYANLNWPAVVEPSGPWSSEDLWRRIESLLGEPDETFIAVLYPLLLGRVADAAGFAALAADLAAGAPRWAVIRRLARSDEARAGGLDVSWMPHLAVVERETVWKRLRALWPARDSVFVDGLYLLLLGRLGDAGGASGFRGQLAAGAARSDVVRQVALSEEGRASGLDVSWLPRLRELERRRRRFSFGFIKSRIRRWLRAVRAGSVSDG